MKKTLKNILLYFVKSINKMMYPRYDVENSLHSQLIIMKLGFFQKVLGVNRHVNWPVHWTTTVNSVNKIYPGTRTPGLGKNCYLDGRNGIRIAENVWIAPHVKIISMNHNVNNYYEYINEKPIIIEKNCWLGSSAIILPGVELGEHTVVAAGAIVTKSFKEGNQVIGGNPAKLIKKLPKYN